MSQKTPQQNSQGRARQYQALVEVAESIAAHQSLSSLLRDLAARLQPVVKFDGVNVVLHDPEQNIMRMNVLETPALPGAEFSTQATVEDSPAGWVWRTQQPMLITDLDAYADRFPQMMAELRRSGVKTAYVLPLTSVGRRLGAVGFGSLRAAAWGEDDQEFLQQVATLVAVAVDNAINFENARRAETELRRRLDQLRLLLDVTNSIATNLDLRELFKVISLCLRQVIHYDGAGMTIYDPESGLLRVYALESGGAKDALVTEGGLVPIEGAPGGEAFRTRRTVLVGRAEMENSPSPLVRDIAASGIKSGCVAPLISRGRALGTLDLASSRENAFGEDDAELLTQIANQIAIAVDNSLNFEDVRAAEKRAAQARDHSQLLLEINNAVASHLDLNELLRAISPCLRQVIHHDFAGLVLYDPERDELRAHATDLPEGKDFFEAGTLFPLEGTPSGQAFRTRQTVMVRNLELEQYASTPLVRILRAEGVKSGVSVPLIAHGQAVGVLTVMGTRENAFSEADAELLTQLCAQIALAVENAITFDRARRAERRAARERDRIKLLLEINNAVVSSLELGELVKTISASLLGALPHDSAGIALYDPELNQLREYSNISYRDLEAFRVGDAIPLEGTPAGQVFLSGRPLLIKRPNQAQYPADLYSQRPVEGSPKSACLAPLISRGRKLGIAGVSSAQEEKFTEDDLELFGQIAGQIAIAVENALNFERAREAERELARKLNHLRLMLKITNTVVSQLDLRELLQVISSNIREVMGTGLGGVALFDHESGQLRAFVTDGSPARAISENGRPIPLESSPSGWAFSSGQPLFLDEPDLVRFTSDLYRRICEEGYKSAGRIPLIAQGRKLGLLNVDSKRESAFSDDDKELLGQIANQIAIAVDNALNFERARAAEEQARRQSERLQLLLEINNAVVSKLDLQGLIDAVSDSLRKIVPLNAVGILIYDPEKNALRPFASDFQNVDPPVSKDYLIPLDKSAEGMAFTTGRPMFVSRFGPESLEIDHVRRVYDAGFRSGGNIPLITHGRKLGVLGVGSLRENAFSDADVQLLCQIANQVAIAVDNALNFERARKAELEVKRQYDQLRLMLEINNAVVSQLDLRELVRVTASCLREILRYELAGLSLYDPEIQQLRAYAYDSPDKRFIIPEGTPIPLEGSLGGRAFLSGQPVFVNRLDSVEITSEFINTVAALGVKSVGCVPLTAHGRKLGFLGVGSFRENAFSEAEQELLGHITNQIAIAVENALNFDQARRAERQYLRERDRLGLLLQVNNAIASALDLPELFRAVSGALRQVFQHDFAVMGLYDGAKEELRAYVLDGLKGFNFLEEGMLVPLDGTPVGVAIATRQPVIVGRDDLRNFSAEVVKRSLEQGLRSTCSVPLLRHDRVIGAMTIASKTESAFVPDDGELLGQIANQVAIAVENAVAYREIDTLKNKLASEKLYLEDEIRTEHNFEELIGASPSFKRILKQIETVAPTGSTVLIRGETGTGKELIARAIHSLSDRRERTLVKINCAAIPSGLLESELFGHEKGAFTGAIAQRIGRFELANKGTLFLDEIGDIPLELQPKLLRVLQEQEFERLGSARTQKVDVRLIAATNCDLEEMVADRKYRSDLYYRLNVFPITIPPLRERPGDIPALTRFFTNKYARRLKKRIEAIPADAMTALTNYHWPGNVRELEHFIERAVVLTQGQELEVSLSELKTASPAVPVNISTLEDAERDHILRALEETQWVIGGPNGAAARLGMKRTTLQSKMQKLGISRSRG
jgi:formate hydrogenlyase transcriptional activator